eukprot:TRINITY_DN8025_c1_g3_i1.p2 TRINITY_DN8025_c1_g3~~TRINITY_DN8025_c1_g3_i1.p2  ORF type:complete len:453 (-),score=124.27 TRINITY_DN8025_c1_g3_i1:30-1388(-)
MGWFTKKVGGEWELGKTIGKGHFSKVKYAVHVKTKEKCAIKVMERKTLQDEHMEDQLKREICIMQKLVHPNITQLRKVYQTRKHVYLVMELITGGELFEKIVQAKRFDEETARKYFQQLILGTYYCHAHGIAHRDLKPENLLLDGNGILKISDFGLSHMQQTTYSGHVEKGMQLTTMCGTPEYVAPEVLTGQGYSGFTADVWSCGVILYVMLSGSLPFRDSPTEPVFDKIKHARYEMKAYFSSEAKDLISHLLTPRAEDRYTIPDICRHPWMQHGGWDPGISYRTTIIAPNSEEVAAAITELKDDDEDGSLTSVPSMTEESFDMLDDAARQGSVSEGNTRFGMRGSPEHVLMVVFEQLQAMRTHPEHKGGNVIKGVAENANGVVTFSVTIMPARTEGVSVVEVKRGRGNTVDFFAFYRDLLQGLDHAMMPMSPRTGEQLQVNAPVLPAGSPR